MKLRNVPIPASCYTEPAVEQTLIRWQTRKPSICWSHFSFLFQNSSNAPFQVMTRLREAFTSMQRRERKILRNKINIYLINKNNSTQNLSFQAPVWSRPDARFKPFLCHESKEIALELSATSMVLPDFNTFDGLGPCSLFVLCNYN